MTNGLEQASMAITEVCEGLKTSPVIGRAIDSFREFLLDKNQKYGNSIYEPVRVFTSASIDSLILVRLNDKATRLLKGESGGEDSFDDLLGYLILRKALPLYLDRDTKEEQDALDAQECGGFERAPVPGHVVTESLKNRGLRVGMTFQEVRDKKWTECEKASQGEFGCTESDPCSACKFLDGAMCKRGHSFTAHHPAMASVASDCHACPRDVECLDFSLASWTNEPIEPSVVFLAPSPDIEEVPGIPSQPDDVIVLPVADPSEGIRTQSEERNAILARTAGIREYAVSVIKELGAGGASMHLHVSTPDLLRFAWSGEEGETCEKIRQHKARTENQGADMAAKKTRVNRATWHETDDGSAAVKLVRDVLESKPPRSYFARELAHMTGLELSVIGLALDRLILTGYAAQHGKAKGTRYAHAGFMAWPAAPTPRKRPANDSPVSEADADAAHSLDASDSEET